MEGKIRKGKRMEGKGARESKGRSKREDIKRKKTRGKRGTEELEGEDT